MTLILLISLSSLIGAVAGLLAARLFLSYYKPDATASAVEPADPFIAAEIDQAAASWAQAQGRPEAAGLLADKLHLLYALDRRRRQP
ncbi:MAG: hypothetical protein JSS97_11635 [Actinobacteria bacterium]|nr:hypothetical protein [Actinomycetota bacterium]